MRTSIARLLAATAALCLALAGPVSANDVDGPDDCLRITPDYDFGDAPEDPAFAYPGVLGHFPTCPLPNSGGTQEIQCGVPQCPAPIYAGMVMHSRPPDGFWLGCSPGGPPFGVDIDPTGKVNDSGGTGAVCNASFTVDCVLSAFGMQFGQDECFGDSDAGLSAAPALTTGQSGSLTFAAHNCLQSPRQVYLNICVDWNQDGDWCDNIAGPGGTCAYEWAVQNALIVLPAGCNQITSPAFLVGPNPGPSWLRITLTSGPVPGNFPWNGSHSMPGEYFEDGETEDYPLEIASGPVNPSYEDYGDAPEQQTAYSNGIVGAFPTCNFWSPPGTQQTAPVCQPISTPPQATGCVIHVSGPTSSFKVWIGCNQPASVDGESDGKFAPVFPASSSCQPTVPTDCGEPAFGSTFAQDECFGDLVDAGVTAPPLTTCASGSVSYQLFNGMGQTATVYVNLLVDMNQDGDWNDALQCPAGCAYEWAVKNQTIQVPAGCQSFTTPAFLVGPTAGESWMRLTVTPAPVLDDFPWAGSSTEPIGCYEGGETEDYPITIAASGPCGNGYEDFGDAPEDVPTYPLPVPGHFPTCLSLLGVPGTQEIQCAQPLSLPPGPTGYVRHLASAQDAVKFWLGCGNQLTFWGIDGEVEGKMHAAPPGTGSFCMPMLVADCNELAWGLQFEQDECWGDLDAGLPPPPLAFGQCTVASLGFQAYSCATAPVSVYLNILIDFNGDGDWNDNIVCSTIQQCAYEWAVKNQPLVLQPGCAGYGSQNFQVGPNVGQGWLRITLSEKPVLDDFPWNGSAGEPNGYYLRGETEDYPIDIADSPIGVGEPRLPTEAWLGPALPNPARDRVTVRFGLPHAGVVKFTVYDAAGRLVGDLASGTRSAGDGSLSWDYRDATGRRVPAGVYHLRMEYAGRTLTQRLVRLK